jgi:hypothetical protein
MMNFSQHRMVGFEVERNARKSQPREEDDKARAVKKQKKKYRDMICEARNNYFLKFNVLKKLKMFKIIFSYS